MFIIKVVFVVALKIQVIKAGYSDTDYDFKVYYKDDYEDVKPTEPPKLILLNESAWYRDRLEPALNYFRIAYFQNVEDEIQNRLISKFWYLQGIQRKLQEIKRQVGKIIDPCITVYEQEMRKMLLPIVVDHILAIATDPEFYQEWKEMLGRLQEYQDFWYYYNDRVGKEGDAIIFEAMQFLDNHQEEIDKIDVTKKLSEALKNIPFYTFNQKITSHFQKSVDDCSSKKEKTGKKLRQDILNQIDFLIETNRDIMRTGIKERVYLKLIPIDLMINISTDKTLSYCNDEVDNELQSYTEMITNLIEEKVKSSDSYQRWNEKLNELNEIKLGVEKNNTWAYVVSPVNPAKDFPGHLKLLIRPLKQEITEKFKMLNSFNQFRDELEQNAKKTLDKCLAAKLDSEKDSVISDVDFIINAYTADMDSSFNEAVMDRLRNMEEVKKLIEETQLSKCESVLEDRLKTDILTFAKNEAEQKFHNSTESKEVAAKYKELVEVKENAKNEKFAINNEKYSGELNELSMELGNIHDEVLVGIQDAAKTFELNGVRDKIKNELEKDVKKCLESN